MAHHEAELYTLRVEVKKLQETVETHGKMLSTMKKMFEHRISQIGLQKCDLDVQERICREFVATCSSNNTNANINMDAGASEWSKVFGDGSGGEYGDRPDRGHVNQDKTQAGKRRRSSPSPGSPSPRKSTEKPNTSTVSAATETDRQNSNPKKANVGKSTDIGRDPNIAAVVGADMDVDVPNGGDQEFEEYLVVDPLASESDNLFAFSTIRQDQSVAMNTNKCVDADARAQATTSAKNTTTDLRREIANLEVDPSMLKNLDQRTDEVVQLKCLGNAEPKNQEPRPKRKTQRPSRLTGEVAGDLSESDSAQERQKTKGVGVVSSKPPTQPKSLISGSLPKRQARKRWWPSEELSPNNFESDQFCLAGKGHVNRLDVPPRLKPTTHGNCVAVVDNHTFAKYYLTGHNKEEVHWRCKKHQTLKCKAKLFSRPKSIDADNGGGGSDGSGGGPSGSGGGGSEETVAARMEWMSRGNHNHP